MSCEKITFIRIFFSARSSYSLLLCLNTSFTFLKEIHSKCYTKPNLLHQKTKVFHLNLCRPRNGL